MARVDAATAKRPRRGPSGRAPAPVSAAAKRTRSTVATIFEALSEAIRQGRMEPGKRLVVGQLMKQFGVSRGPIREALNRLADEGLATLEFNQGARVRMFSREEMRVLSEAREMIESAAAELAAARFSTSDRRSEFHAICIAIEKAAAEGARDTFLALDEAFHDMIMAMAGNAALRAMVKQLNVRIVQAQLRNYHGDGFTAASTDSFMPLAQSEHRSIAEAIRAGDPERAKQAMRAHLGRLTKLYSSLPDRFYEPS